MIFVEDILPAFENEIKSKLSGGNDSWVMLREVLPDLLIVKTRFAEDVQEIATGFAKLHCILAVEAFNKKVTFGKDIGSYSSRYPTQIIEMDTFLAPQGLSGTNSEIERSH